MEKNLELTIRMDNDHVEIDIYEPESGECSQIDAPLSFDEHPEFDKNIGDEIYSWLSLWADELAGKNYSKGPHNSGGLFSSFY